MQSGKCGCAPSPAGATAAPSAAEMRSRQCGCATSPTVNTAVPSTAETTRDIRVDPKENLALKKEVYVQTQNWARHNETLIVATNTILLGAIAAICTNFFKEPAAYQRALLLLPTGISVFGIAITAYLSWQYKRAITRVVVYERYFGLHGECLGLNGIEKHSSKRSEWTKAFVPEYLAQPPSWGAMSTRVFSAMHIALIAVFITAYFLKGQA